MQTFVCSFPTRLQGKERSASIPGALIPGAWSPGKTELILKNSPGRQELWVPGCWSLASRSSDCTALLIALLVQAVIFQGVGRRCRFGGYVQLILAPLLAADGMGEALSVLRGMFPGKGSIYM